MGALLRTGSVVEKREAGSEICVADGVGKRIDPIVEVTGCISGTRSGCGTVSNFGAKSYDVVGAGVDK